CCHDIQLHALPAILRPVCTNLFHGKPQTLLHARREYPFAAQFFKDVGSNKSAQFGIDGLDDGREVIALDIGAEPLNEPIVESQEWVLHKVTALASHGRTQDGVTLFDKVQSFQSFEVETQTALADTCHLGNVIPNMKATAERSKHRFVDIGVFQLVVEQQRGVRQHQTARSKSCPQSGFKAAGLDKDI